MSLWKTQAHASKNKGSAESTPKDSCEMEQAWGFKSQPCASEESSEEKPTEADNAFRKYV